MKSQDLEAIKNGSKDLPFIQETGPDGKVTKHYMDKDTEKLFEPTPDKLPDTEKLLDDIAMIRVRCEELEEDKLNNVVIYRKKLDEEFREFADRYPTLFKKVISGEDLSRLAEMIYYIEKIRSKKTTFEAAEEELGKNMAKDYIKPK